MTSLVIGRITTERRARGGGQARGSMGEATRHHLDDVLDPCRIDLVSGVAEGYAEDLVALVEGTNRALDPQVPHLNHPRG